MTRTDDDDGVKRYLLAMLVALFFHTVALIGLTVVVFYTAQQRSGEHDDLACLIKLDIFMHSGPPGEAVEWRHMPPSIGKCLPQFVVEKKQQEEENGSK